MRLGGAGSVGVILSALEARSPLACVVGDDREGESIRNSLPVWECRRLPGVRAGRPTTLKERILGGTPSRILSKDPRRPRVPRTDRRRHRVRALGAGPDRLHEVDLVLFSDLCQGSLHSEPGSGVDPRCPQGGER